MSTVDRRAPAARARADEILDRRGARLRRRAARALRRRAASELLRRRRARTRRRRHARLPRRDRGDPRGRLAGRRRRARTTRTAASRSPGPTDRKLVINALNSGAQGLHGRLRGRELADLGEPGRGPREPDRRDRAARSPTTPRTASTTSWTTTSRRCWCARAAGTCPRSTCRSTASRSPARCWTSGSTSSTTRQRLLDARQRPVLLPAEAGAPPRGAAVERRLRVRPGGARPPARARSARRC